MPTTLIMTVQRFLDMTKHADFIALLAIRLYLFPIFWQAGSQKLLNIDTVSAFFGSNLGFPLPTLMAYLAGLTEFLGAIFLLVGFATRLITIPLLFVMLVAIFSVHWEHGWYMIMAPDSEAVVRLNYFMTWLQENFPDRYTFITELGKPAILGNGIQFGATYFIMLLVLFFFGAGRYCAVDYWLTRKYHEQHGT